MLTSGSERKTSLLLACIGGWNTRKEQKQTIIEILEIFKRRMTSQIPHGIPFLKSRLVAEWAMKGSETA